MILQKAFKKVFKRERGHLRGVWKPYWLVGVTGPGGVEGPTSLPTLLPPPSLVVQNTKCAVSCYSKYKIHHSLLSKIQNIPPLASNTLVQISSLCHCVYHFSHKQVFNVILQFDSRLGKNPNIFWASLGRLQVYLWGHGKKRIDMNYITENMTTKKEFQEKRIMGQFVTARIVKNLVSCPD